MLIHICAWCFPKTKGLPLSGLAAVKRNGFQSGPSHGICAYHINRVMPPVGALYSP